VLAQFFDLEALLHRLKRKGVVANPEVLDAGTDLNAIAPACRQDGKAERTTP
jgi:hypothetical protein